MNLLKRYMFVLVLFFLPSIVFADTKFEKVQSIDELEGDNRILFVVDDNVFTFVDILENPTSVEVDTSDGINAKDVDINNIFVIKNSDSSISGNTLKVKPLVIGDTSASCSKNKPCSKGNLYLKDSMFHYQDKEIKIEQLTDGGFSVRSDNSHYLNYKNNEWGISSNEQSISIYKEVEIIEDNDSKEETTTKKLEYITDDILIIGATKKDTSDETNESYVDIIVHYDLAEEKEFKIKFKYKNSDTVDLKIKFIDKYSDDLFESRYDYLFNSDDYLDSDYLITRMYVTQDSNYSNIVNENVSNKGGLFDNVVGKSILHIYVSSKYSAEYYVGDEIVDKLTSINKYYINPDYYVVPDSYESSIEIDNINNSEYVLPKGISKYLYNMDMSGYESKFNLSENELGLPWYLNGKKVNSPFEVSENVLEASNKIFKFVSYVEIENPNTAVGPWKLLFIIVSLYMVLILSKRRFV